MGVTRCWGGWGRMAALSHQRPGGPGDVVDNGIKAAIRVVGLTQTSGTHEFITVFPEVN